MWCIPNLNNEFRERMEDIIKLYTEPLPEGHELHNFDEASKQMLSTPRGSTPTTPATATSHGRDKHTDYEYKRHGTRNLFVAVAPFAGIHTAKVTKRRTAQDTADFLWQYCMVEHGSEGTVSQPKHIDLVLDNLNTHLTGSLKRIWGKRKHKKFEKHVTLHHTPKHASWLNLAELEINCLRRQGLKNRIGDEQTLAATVAAIVAERNARKATISWSFGIDKAKRTFAGLYD